MALVEVKDLGGAGRGEWCRQLEEGDVLFFPRTPIPMTEEDRAFLLGVRQAASGYHKNISYRPRTDRIRGVARGTADVERLHSILRDYSRGALALAASLLAPYRQRWDVDFASFRPFEEDGRPLSRTARNDLLHVDAFPSRPTRGNRILRIFTNLNPAASRIWLTTEGFDVLASRFAADAGLRDVASGRAGLGPWLARAARAIGLPVPDRTAYDRFMLRFHDYLKENERFQETCPKVRMEFPPGSTWLAYTDMVAHAVLSGQYAIEQTLIVHREALVAQERAPLRILEGVAGRRLA
jgi:hypothetical protein